MRKFIRSICLLLVAALVLPLQVFAAENSSPKASEYFAADSCYLYQTSATSFEVWFDVSAVGMMDEVGAKTVKVQRSTDGTNWTDVKTFSSSSYSQMIDYNTGAHACGLPYTATKGYYYRAYVQFYAKKGSGSATLSRYTSKIRL